MIGEQLELVGSTRPPAPPPGVRLLCGDVLEAVALAEGVGLVHADPPWSYSAGVPGNGKQADHYSGLPVEAIVQHVEASFEAAAADCYLVLWSTWPFLGKWTDAHRGLSWEYVSGGSWTKYRVVGPDVLELGPPGIGYNWRGKSEPILLYRKGSPKPLGLLRNAHVDLEGLLADSLNTVEPRARHSEKPLAFLERILEAFLVPGGEVLDLYSGLAPLARAAVRTGRRYLGAELDPERHAAALSLLVQDRS